MDTEIFLKNNCGPDIIITDGKDVNYDDGHWNIAYGNVIIDPKKYPRANYKWKFQIGEKGNENIRIGISSTWTRMDSPVFMEISPSYAHCCQWEGYSIICGKLSDYFEDIKGGHKSGDMIKMVLSILDKQISFYVNDEFLWKHAEIDTTVRYKLCLQLSQAHVILKEFEAIWDIEVLVEGFIKGLYDDSGIGYDDISNLITKYCSFD